MVEEAKPESCLEAVVPSLANSLKYTCKMNPAVVMEL
jgi:hypothetical protein